MFLHVTGFLITVSVRYFISISFYGFAHNATSENGIFKADVLVFVYAVYCMFLASNSLYAYVLIH